MIVKAVKKACEVNSKVQYGIYNIMKQSTVTNQEAIPLYESGDLKDIHGKQSSMHKFMQLTPFFIEKMMGWQRKQFVVKMELLPESKQLKIKCLGHDQQIDKIVELENLVPVTWEDYFQASKRRLFAIPPFVDVDMVYYNQSQDEFYLFDNTGKWDSEGIEHPVLSLAQNFNEKKWFDSVRII